MTSRKPVQLEFTDCIHCGKRIATTARRCHHCQATFTNLVRPKPTTSNHDLDEELEEVDSRDSHMSLSYGGYDNQDMDDTDEELDSSPRKLWRFVAWVLLIVFSVFALMPFLL